MNNRSFKWFGKIFSKIKHKITGPVAILKIFPEKHIGEIYAERVKAESSIVELENSLKNETDKNKITPLQNRLQKKKNWFAKVNKDLVKYFKMNKVLTSRMKEKNITALFLETSPEELEKLKGDLSYAKQGVKNAIENKIPVIPLESKEDRDAYENNEKKIERLIKSLRKKTTERSKTAREYEEKTLKLLYERSFYLNKIREMKMGLRVVDQIKEHLKNASGKVYFYIPGIGKNHFQTVRAIIKKNLGNKVIIKNEKAKIKRILGMQKSH